MNSCLIKCNNVETFFRVDFEDSSRIMKYQWYISTRGYIQGNVNKVTTMLHRFIMNYSGEDTINHIDRDKLNNCKSNLQIVSHSDNTAYRTRYIGKSGYPNVKVYNKNTFWVNFKLNFLQFKSKKYDTAFKAAVEVQNLMSIHRPNVDINIVWRGTLQ